MPPIQHLALAATLSIHPSLTTRTGDGDKHDAADDAMMYLRAVLRVVGVKGAGLDRALHFTAPSHAAPRSTRGKHAKTKTRQSDALADDDEGDDVRSLRSPYATKESLWTNADDFWAVVGWAFNCSITHRHRWERWHHWLTFMLDVLSSDLEAHAADNTVDQSMLATYLRPIGEGRNNKRRLMRAILADGSSKSLAEFSEVWKNETALPKSKRKAGGSGEGEGTGKKRKLDIAAGEFGDYFSDDDDDSRPAMSLPRSRSATAFAASARASRQASGSEDEDNSEATAKIDPFGGTTSIRLRQRLLALLVEFCHLSPATFLDTEDLFDLYTEFLRPLPLPDFQALLFPPKPWLGADAQCSLIQMLLRPLLATAAPGYDDNALTQKDFEVAYAPFAANTTAVSDNAKVGLLIEQLLVLLLRNKQLVYSKPLRRSVERGIAAREAKVGTDGRKKRSGAKGEEDEEALRVLECCGGRMRARLDLLEGKGGG